jgi:hypothetical protein
MPIAIINEIEITLGCGSHPDSNEGDKRLIEQLGAVLSFTTKTTIGDLGQALCERRGVQWVQQKGSMQASYRGCWSSVLGA